LILKKLNNEITEHIYPADRSGKNNAGGDNTGSEQNCGWHAVVLPAAIAFKAFIAGTFI